MERIVAVEGTEPILLIAPHGPDDINTGFLVEKIAEELGAYYIINNGWLKSKTVNYWKEMANCNNISHLHEDVIKEEFLDPIIKFKDKIKKKFDGENVILLIIHGCGNHVREIANDNIDMIVGCGKGGINSCKRKIKNAFIWYLKKEGFCVYEGEKKYAAKSRNNLTQLFNYWYPESDINVIQLEIVKELRTDKNLIKKTISGIVNVLDLMTMFDDSVIVSSKEIKTI